MTDTFFLLVRSGLYGTTITAEQLPAEIDWEEILLHAKQQTVMGLVADAVSRLPESAQPPEDIRLRLKKFAEKNMFSHIKLNRTLAKTVSILSQNDIDSVLLKGQGIARCYRVPELRQCGDIDLYVGKENYKRACEVALRELHDGDEETDESEKHLHLSSGGVSIELHRIAAKMFAPWHNSRLQEWSVKQLTAKENLQTADFFGEKVCLPSADFNAFFIFLHLWHHFLYGGIGLRQICDWTMVLHIHKDEIDREALGKLLKRLGLMKPWRIIGYIAVTRLGLPQDEMPFCAENSCDISRGISHKISRSISKNGEKVLARILNCGNFGRYEHLIVRDKKRMKYLHRKFVSLCESIYLLARYFPYAPTEILFYFPQHIYTGVKRVVSETLFMRR